MTDLIKKLEALEAPCRECDAAIFRTLAGNPTDHCYEWNGKYLIDANVWPVTACVTSAMTLVPKGYRICNISQHDHQLLRERGEWMCSLYPDGHIDDCNRNFDWPRCKHAATPAIALCIAALRAQETSNAGR